MADFDGVTSLLILAATLVGILWRPRGISEAWIAAAGGVAMVLVGPLPLKDLPPLLRSTADVLLFLAGMMLLTVLVERAGVFDVLAEGCARLARVPASRSFASSSCWGRSLPRCCHSM